MFKTSIIKKIFALLVASIIYVFQKRLGMFIISFLLLDFILKKGFTLNAKTLRFSILSIILFIVGFKLSVFLACEYYALIGGESLTFWGGFGGGIIELETYLLFSLIPLKWINCKNLILSLKSTSIEAIVCFIIGGLVQGSYLAGWQNIYI